VAGERRRHDSQPLFGESLREHSHGRGEIGVSRNEQCVIEMIAVSTVQEVERDIHIGLLLFMPHRRSATPGAPAILCLELAHHWCNAGGRERGNLCAVPMARREKPIRVGREVVDGDDRLRPGVNVPTDQRAKVNPLEVGPFESRDRVIAVESVDEGDDPSATHVRLENKNPTSLSPWGPQGSTLRDDSERILQRVHRSRSYSR
jgi:hypothetical protein